MVRQCLSRNVSVRSKGSFFGTVKKLLIPATVYSVALYLVMSQPSTPIYSHQCSEHAQCSIWFFVSASGIRTRHMSLLVLTTTLTGYCVNFHGLRLSR